MNPLAPLPTLAGTSQLPAMIEAAGKRARVRFVEFFTANIRNPNTWRVYAQAIEKPRIAAFHRATLAAAAPMR